MGLKGEQNWAYFKGTVEGWHNAQRDLLSPMPPTLVLPGTVTKGAHLMRIIERPVGQQEAWPARMREERAP